MDRVEDAHATAAVRLRTGLNLNDDLSECLKVGRMNQLADIEKVYMEAQKLMSGIPKLQQAADKCSKIRYVICEDFFGSLFLVPNVVWRHFYQSHHSCALKHFILQPA